MPLPFQYAAPPVYTPPVVSTIAGSDSGGGAGIQADLKTFAAMRVFGTSVVTLITAQNTRGVQKIEVLDQDLIRGQFAAVNDDFEVAATKTGALGSERIIEVVAELVSTAELKNLVVDPVMISKHGHPLLPESAHRVFIERMLEPAAIVTPNRFEAEVLSGRRVEGVATMRDAARAIFDRGARAVVIKGPHLDGKVVRDIFYDGSGFLEFGADKLDSKSLHGSGCAYSAAICARLAHGDSIEEALNYSRLFISGAIEMAPDLGHGVSPVNPMHEVWT